PMASRPRGYALSFHMIRTGLFSVIGLLVAVGAASAASVASTAVTEPADLAAEARAILGSNQGVYVENASGQVLLAQAAGLPVHRASVSKVPTTLALLRKLGPEYRFVTTFSTDGRVVGDMLAGDLLVAGSGNPSLVDEDALLVADQMIAMGIRQVSGDLK